MEGQSTGGWPDAWLAAVAEAQHGVVALWQMRDAGFRRGEVDSRLARARLHIVHRGVYAVGRPGLGREGRWMAAVLALGATAVLSHRSAAAHWGLVPAGDASLVHVAVPKDGPKRRNGDRGAPRPGARSHRARRDPGDDGPVDACSTSLRASTRRPLERAIERAVRAAAVRPPRAIERRRSDGPPGGRALLEAVAAYDDAPDAQRAGTGLPAALRGASAARGRS